MTTDTWAQDHTGHQGLTSVAYEDADDESIAWAMQCSEDEDEEE